MSFIAGLILGGIIGGSCGLIIATLMIASGRASEDERIAELEKSTGKMSNKKTP